MIPARLMPFAVLLLTLCPLGAQPAAADDPAEAQRELEEVQDRIGKLERQIEAQLAKRGDAERALRDAERSESGVRRKLKRIGDALASARQRLKELEAETVSIREDLSAQVSILEEQIRAAWVAGRDDWLRGILSEDDPAEIGRQLVYHGYIARERTDVIDQIRDDLDRLAAVQSELADERARLEQNQADERERLRELTDLRARRAEALVRIDKGLESRNQQVDRLRSQAEDLEQLIAELTRILAALPSENFASFGERKGRMRLPASGPVVRSYGQSKADGRMRWEGILVGAPAGAEVRAIHYGRVVFADWLPGMGLLAVLEHGEGYLSLYGHNQDLMVEVGDWVDPETVIGHVGDSGGQAATGLYFEIRKDGAPQNPTGWLAP